MTDRLYQVHTEPVSTSPETVTESRWHQPWSEPTRGPFNLFSSAGKLMAVVLAASSPVNNPFTPTPPIINESSWHRPLEEPVRIRSLNIALQRQQQFSVFDLKPPPVKLDMWYRALEEPVRIKSSISTAAQQFFTWDLKPIAQVITYWFEPLSEPVRSRFLPAALQQFTQIDTKPWPTVDGWYRNLNEPVRTKPSLPSSEQSFFTFVEFAISLDSWFKNLEEPVRFRSLHPSQKLFSFVDPGIFVPEIITIDRWYIQWNNPSDPIKLRPTLQTKLQMVSAFDAGGALTPFVPLGKYTVRLAHQGYTISFGDLGYAVSFDDLEYTIRLGNLTYTSRGRK